jgi:hypothetical protein
VCEILTAEIPEIDEALVGNDGKHLETIFGFFAAQRDQFNILLASLVVKLICSLLSTHLLVDVCTFWMLLLMLLLFLNVDVIPCCCYLLMSLYFFFLMSVFIHFSS